MKALLRPIAILLTAILFFQTARSQTPVQVTPQLLPPYSLQVSEYYSGIQPKLQVLLLNRDISQPTIQVKLRLTIESQNCRMQTKANAVTPTFTLTSGIPYYMTPSELQPFFAASNIDFGGGYNEQQYLQTGRLPEGLYSFYIEAFELATGNLVSNKGFTLGWLTLADPPLLNTPSRAEGVTPGNPQNIIFNWTPRHNTSPTAGYLTDYIFSIAEYNDINIGPEASFSSSPPLFIDSVQTTTYLFGPGQPQLIPGKRYAWRVQAKAKNGSVPLAMFRNNGYSEVYWFTYQNNCAAPVGIGHTVQGTRATIEWTNNPQHMEWKVEYREKNNPDAQWFSINNTIPRVMLTDLRPSTQYEYRVGGSCITGQFTYSALFSFTTAGSPVPPVANCGDSVLVSAGGGQLLQNLNAGDTLRAGTFTVNVGTSTGVGSFTGMGYVKVPWLMNAKVEVRFTNITLSLDRKLMSGVIETTYDPTESGIGDIDEYIDIFVSGYGVGGVITGQILVDTTVGFPILWPGGIAVTLPPGYNPITGLPAPGTTIPIVLTNAQTGAQTTLQVSHLPTTLQDANGNIYQVNANGVPTLVGMAGGNELLQNMNKKVIDGDKALVVFKGPAGAKYAFDQWQPVYKKSTAVNKEYEKIPCVSGGLSINDGNYYVSAKAIAPAVTDTILAVIRKPAGSIISKDSIQFVNSKGTRFVKTAVNDSTFAIVVVGGPEKDAQEIYAVYKQTTAKTLNFGKLLVASYPRKEFKVKLVPVNGDLSDIQQISDSLNRIYNQVNINISLTKLAVFQDTLWDVNRNGKLDTDGNSFLSTYSSEFTILKNNFTRIRGTEPNNYYLFILNSAENSAIKGEMPRGKNFGAIFSGAVSNKPRTIAHELGHGIFRLKHIFDGYGFSMNEMPENLLDYSEGNRMSKFQWDLIHDPALVLGMFDSDDDARDIGVKNLTTEFLNDDGLTYTFITYAGQSINVPKEASDFLFNFGIGAFASTEKLVTGVLQQFKFNNNTYSASFLGGVSYKSTTGQVYQNINVGGGEKYIIMAMPNEESLTVYKFSAVNLPKYNHLALANPVEEKDFSILPFSATNPATKNVNNNVIEYTMPTSMQIGEQWRYDADIYKRVLGFSKKPEMIYVSKIAQFAKAYPGYFSEFTSAGSDWFYPNQITTEVIDGNTVISSNPYRPGVWGSKIDAAGSVLPQLFQSNKPEYYKLMLTDLRTYIGSEIQAKGIFFDTVTTNAALTKVIKYTNNSSEFECSAIKFDKIKVVLDIMIRAFANGDWMTVFSPGHQKAIVKILKSVKPEYYSQTLEYLSNVNTLPVLEEYLKNISGSENYYAQYINIVRNFLANVEKPTVNQVISEGSIFQHMNKGPDHYTKISPVDMMSGTPEIVFFYKTSAPYVPYNSTELQHTGEKKVNYFSYILLRLDDDYTFDGKLIFAKKDFPNGILLSGIELYWMYKEQYELLSSRFSSFMIAGLAMVVTGPELAVTKGWRLILAVADFQFAAKVFVSTSPQYQQLIANNPRLAAYFNAWDNFNKVYGVCRITQLTAELAVTKWAAVKSAATDVKNDVSISSSVKNELKIDGIVLGAENPNLINSLKAKLTEPGYGTLQTWKAGKNINFVDEFGTTINGTSAETKLFTELDTKVGNKNVTGTFIDPQGKLLVQTEGVNRNIVYGVMKNSEGNYIVYEFKPAYKPLANTEINAGLSEYKLGPDYRKNLTGGVSQEYLCPSNLLPPGKSPVVRIKMTGKRTGSNGDFYNANIEIGRIDLGDKAITDYVWHHLDDMEIINGEAWCTMQLVRQDAHMKLGLQGMTHSGSPAQWTAYYGIPYK